MVGNNRKSVYDPIRARDRLNDEEMELLRKRGLVENEEIKTVWRLESYETEFVSFVTAMMYISAVAELVVLKMGWLDAFVGVDLIAQIIRIVVLGLSALIIWNGYRYIETAMSSSQLMLFSHGSILGGYRTRRYDVRRTFVYSVVIILCWMNGFYGIAAVFMLSTLWLRLSEGLLRYRIEEKIKHIRKDSVNHGIEC